MSARRASWLIGLSALVAAACRPLETEPPRVLVLRLVRPANPDGVYLNEDLVFHFSSEVDRASATRDAVRIATRDGRPARGTLLVDGASVRFVPAPVLARDLSDGGYLPGTDYLVEIAGFPRPDGLRGADGEPLQASFRWAFRTVDVREPRDRLVFEDRDPDRVRPLRLFPPTPTGEPRRIGPQDALFLKCDEPLDPSTILDGAFELVFAERRSEPQRVRLRARLIENEPYASVRPRPQHVRPDAFPDTWEREPRAALIELLPERPLLTNGVWHLAFQPRLLTWALRVHPFSGGAAPWCALVPRLRDAAPRDLGGRRVVWDPALLRTDITVDVAGRDALGGALLEPFLDTRLRSTVAVPGVDGTAAWSDSGRVEVRWPAAAGLGRDGDATLGATEERRDVQAIALDLPAGTTCQLPAAPGPVVLRAQGALRIQGRLERRTGAALAPMRFDGGTLSRWVDDQLSLDPAVAARAANWTVLIAGGDLWIDGDVAVDTPLLVCAGGRIRVAGSVRAGRADQLFRLGEGGGEGLVASNVEDLVLDAPTSNPLRRALRFAVLSGPLPPRGEVAEWLEAEARGWPEVRGGPWSVRYVPELSGAPSAAEDLRAVDHPRLLPRVGPMHLLVELVVEPGPAWRPPFVDYVRLTWREAVEGGR